jgi:hypothetical protein
VIDARTDRTPGGRLPAGTAAGALALGVAALAVVLRHAAV